MNQTVLVNACNAKDSLSVVELEDGRRRVIRAQSIGGQWIDQATMAAPISRRAAQRLIDDYTPGVAGPTQEKFIEEATKGQGGVG